MGLRVNSNLPSLSALRNLREADIAQRRSLERLSTGLRINRASDDPSGLVISEQLRSQLNSMQQALENSENASNLISTTEAALNEVSNLLIELKESIVFALNSGGNDDDQIAAEQDAIDNALSAIDRVAATTRYGTRKLLDGGGALSVTATTAGMISDINVQNAQFDGTTSRTFTVNVTTVASHANVLTAAQAYGGAQASNATIRISGEDGTQDVVISSAFSVAQFNDAINQYTGDTGIYASAGRLFSTGYGSDQTISLEVISGQLNVAAFTPASGVQTDSGADVTGNVNGMAINADGFDIRVSSDVMTADITLSDGTDGNTLTTAGAAPTFTVSNSGLVFQLNQTAGSADREQIGIRNMHVSTLGFAARTVNGMGGAAVTVGGFLSTLEGGGANDLSTNPGNALRIVDSAISQVTDMRSYLGAFQAQQVDANTRSLGVAIENLTASESTIRDLDFAAETAEFTKNQILFQSGIAVLAQSNLVSQSVLTLLG